MKGKLGSIHVGKLCFGGFIDWQLDTNLVELKGEPPTYKLGKWQLSAQGYWLFDIPSKVTIRLYPDSGKGYWEGKGVVTSQVKHVWDTLMHEPIEFVGEGILEGRE